MVTSEALKMGGHRSRFLRVIGISPPNYSAWVPQVSILRPGIAQTLSPCSGPERLDLHCPNFARRVMQETRPLPFFRRLCEAALDRVAVHVAQLLDAFQFVVHVEVVIARLPEWTFPPLDGYG